jgi:hypothetical protein
LSYHIGGHKPKAKPRAAPAPIWIRILLAAAGAAVFIGAKDAFRGGRLFGLNSLRQPVYPEAAMGMGALLILLALIPWSWLDRVAKRFVRRRSPAKAPRTGGN